MDNLMNSLLLPQEQILTRIIGTFEMQENTGINYYFGELIATDKRLIWFTKYPFGWKETKIYRYVDIINVDITQSLFTFHNDVSIKLKSINIGNSKQFLETIQYISTYKEGIRNYFMK